LSSTSALSQEIPAHDQSGRDSRSEKSNGKKQSSSTRTEEGYVSAEDGARLFYRKVGNGRQAVIIPLGFMLFDDFKRLAPGRTLIFYDMRNRGQSDPVTEGARINIDKDVSDVEAIRKHFGFGKISLIGESYLGLMVVMYAMQYPQNVDRIIQIGAVPLKFGTKYSANLTAQDKEPAIDPIEDQKLRKLEQDGYHKSNPKDYCEKEWQLMRPMFVGKREDAHKVGPGYCHLSNEWPVNLARHFAHHFTSVQKLDISKAEVARVKHPVLTIHGTQDRNAAYGSGREWAVMLPGARLITVAGAAHFPWIEAPELVFSSVDTFLRGKWPMQAERIREGEVEIRIANYSKVPIENLRVYFGSQIEEYGTVAAKGVTEYRKVRNAYRYARIEAIVEGERAQLQPIDFVGEAELKPGKYTYILTINKKANSEFNRLQLKCRKDSILFLVSISSTSRAQQVIRVPQGDGTPVLIDGRIVVDEWRDALSLNVDPSVKLYFKQFRGHVYFGIKVDRASPAYVDVFLMDGDHRLYNLHASMQIGERLLVGNDWTDASPVTNWGNSSDWIANEAKINAEQDERLPISKRFFPYDGIEYQIRRKRFVGRTWRIRVEVRDFAGQLPDTVFPANSQRRDSKHWAILNLDGPRG
jgi:proline iminopeptidase